MKKLLPYILFFLVVLFSFFLREKLVNFDVVRDVIMLSALGYACSKIDKNKEEKQ